MSPVVPSAVDMGKWWLRGLLFVLCAVMMTALPARAWADGEPGTPEDLKRRADDAMVALRYSDALALYKQAFDSTKNPALLYNMGRAYEGLGEFPKALDALEEFNDKAPAELKARVPKLDALLADVRNRVATLIVTTTVAGAEVKLGERVVGKTRSGQTILRVTSGKQMLEVTREGYFPYTREITLTGGKVETVDALLASRTEKGVIKITSPAAGASVTVDGTSWGNVPAEAYVFPGQHKVILRRDGYDTTETNVVLAAGEKKDVNVAMAVHETITQKWWFWTGIGVVVVGGVVATVVALTTERSADSGTIPPGQVKASLIRF